MLPTLPQAVAALRSPRIQFELAPAAYAAFKAWWGNGTGTFSSRRLDVLAWSFRAGAAADGSVVLDDAARRCAAGRRWAWAQNG